MTLLVKARVNVGVPVKDKAIRKLTVTATAAAEAEPRTGSKR